MCLSLPPFVLSQNSIANIETSCAPMPPIGVSGGLGPSGDIRVRGRVRVRVRVRLRVRLRVTLRVSVRV